MIDYLCLSYYTPNNDFFDKVDKNKIRLSDHQMTVTSFNSKRAQISTPIIGHHLIDSLSSKTHQWIFRINKNKHGIYIGIQRDEEDPKWVFDSFSAKPSYCVHIDKRQKLHKWYNGGSCGFVPIPSNLAYEGVDGKVLLILKNGELTISVKDHAIWNGKAIEQGKHIQYRMALCMKPSGDSVTLLKYTES